MNNFYRVVFNASLSIFQVASELARSKGRSKRGVNSKATKLRLLLFLVLSNFFLSSVSAACTSSYLVYSASSPSSICDAPDGVYARIESYDGATINNNGSVKISDSILDYFSSGVSATDNAVINLNNLNIEQVTGGFIGINANGGEVIVNGNYNFTSANASYTIGIAVGDNGGGGGPQLLNSRVVMNGDVDILLNLGVQTANSGFSYGIFTGLTDDSVATTLLLEKNLKVEISAPPLKQIYRVVAGGYFSGNTNTTLKGDQNIFTLNGSNQIGLYLLKGSTVNVEKNLEISAIARGGRGILIEGGVANLGLNSKISTAGDGVTVNSSGIGSLEGSINILSTEGNGLVVSGVNSLAAFNMHTPNLVQITTLADNKSAVNISDGGSVYLGGGILETSGKSAHAVMVNGEGSVFNSNAALTITTSGQGSHGISLQNGAIKSFDGQANNILPSIKVVGADSAMLHATGISSNLTLVDQVLNVANTPNADTFGVKSEQGGSVIFTGNSSSGGTRLWAAEGMPFFGSSNGKSGSITISGLADAAGSHVKLEDEGVLNIAGATSDVRIGSLDSADTTTLVNFGNKTLYIGSDNADQTGTLIDAEYSGKFSNLGGHLVKEGRLTQTLSGLDNTVSSVNVTGGNLKFSQSTGIPGSATPFNVTGNYTTYTDATTEIGAQNSTLKIGGSFTQQANSHLVMQLGALPDITASTASLDGDLSVTGFALSGAPNLASEITNQDYTVIRTTGGITGDFTAVNGVGSSGLDYLLASGHKSADNKDYVLGFRLAWSDGGQAAGTGDFTLASGTAFTVDVPLVDQVVPVGGFASGWDGKSLVKAGAGTLTLSTLNGYSGATEVSQGKLSLSGAGSIANSRVVNLSSPDASLDISTVTGDSTQVQNLMGAGGSRVDLGAKMLKVQSSTDTTMLGDIVGSGGLVKEGAGSLTLTGQTAWASDTYLNEGRLVLDGSAGKAQLVSNVIGQTGTTLQLINGGQLTGWIDPADVMIDRVSRWTMTANSDVATMNLAGNIQFASPGSTFVAGRTLTANNWVGEEGVVSLYTVLGNSQSVSDKLVIDAGQATGRTFLNIQNAGGLGDLTTGDGINVVQTKNGATTTVDAFDLANAGRRVTAGAYEYRLARNGQDWFLISSSIDEERPSYSPTTSLYSAKAEQALQYAESTLGTLHERMGDIEALNLKSGAMAWSRVLSQRHHNDGASDGIYDRSIGSRGELSALQMGSDIYVNAQGMGRTSVGGFLTLGQGKADVRHVGPDGKSVDAGSNGLTAYGLAGYLTHLSGKGEYLDSVIQVTSLDQSSSPRAMSSNSNRGLSVIASAEVGQRFDLEGRLSGWYLEPQAQFVVQTLKQSDSKAASNVGSQSTVSFDTSTTLTSRVGVRLSRDWVSGDSLPGSVWVTPSLINTSGADSKTRFSTLSQGDVVFGNKLAGTSTGLQVGVDGYVTKNVNVNARLGGEINLSGDRQASYGTQIGVKIAF